jgi:hypothetical protein
MTISVAFDQLGPDNWGDFCADIVAQETRAGKRMKGLLLGGYLRVIDPLLRLSERLGGRRATAWGRR